MRDGFIGFVRDMWDEPAIRWLFISGAALVCVCLYFIHLDNEQWDEFAREHNCRVVGKSRGDTHVGLAGDSLVVMGSSNKTSWLCDDGVVYER